MSGCVIANMSGAIIRQIVSKGFVRYMTAPAVRAGCWPPPGAKREVPLFAGGVNSPHGSGGLSSIGEKSLGDRRAESC